MKLQIACSWTAVHLLLLGRLVLVHHQQTSFYHVVAILHHDISISTPGAQPAGKEQRTR